MRVKGIFERVSRRWGFFCRADILPVPPKSGANSYFFGEYLFVKITPRPAARRHIFAPSSTLFGVEDFKLPVENPQILPDQRASSMRMKGIGKMSRCRQIRHI